MRRSVTVIYEQSLEQELRSYSLHWRAALRPWVRVVARIVGVSILAICIASIATSGPSVTAVVLLVLSGYGLFVLPWEARRHRRKAFRASPGFNARVSITLSEDGVEIRVGDLLNSTVAWPLFKKLLRTPEGMLLYTGPASFLWLPYTAFGSADDRSLAEELLDSHVNSKSRVA